MQLRTRATWALHIDTLKRVISYLETAENPAKTILDQDQQFATIELPLLLDDAKEALAELEDLLIQLKPILRPARQERA